MEEYILNEYMRNRDSESEFVNRMKDVLGSSRARGRRRTMREKDSWNSYRHNDSQLKGILEDLTYEDKEKLMYMLNRSSEELDKSEAKQIVSEMWHTNNDRKYVGEKFTMEKAKEVYNKYKHILSDFTVEEVYVAINAQYHDYCSLFKNWFGDNIDNKIIESAIKFWFMDVDYSDGNKVLKYFME